jgi:hypothetical protein
MEIIKLNGRRLTFAIVLIFVVSLHSIGQDYPLLYENNFEKEKDLSDFEFSDAAAWKLSDSLDNKSLELFGFSRYELPVSSPFNIAVLKTVRVGSFVLEVDLEQTSIEYPHRDMCLFFNMKNPTNYYYVHIASVADPHAHTIILVNDEPQANITSKVSDGIQWGNQWHKVRIERDVKVGIIKVFFDNMKIPIMEATDTHFDSGYVGFGSFDDSGLIDNIKLWGEEVNPCKDFLK